MKTLSIVIPVYNEEERLDKTFKAFSELQLPRGLKLEKVIFVDDGSYDNSKFKIQNSKLAIEKLLNTKVEIVSYKNNHGKGYAIARGMKESNSDYTLFCDADMSTHISEIKKFMPFMNRNIPIIIGTRKNGQSTVVKHQPFYRELLGKGFTGLSNIVLNMKVTDFTCGFKAFSRLAKNEIFIKSNIDGWGFDSEILYLASQLGYEIQEVPVVWMDYEGSKVNIFTDLPKSLIDIFKIRFTSYYPHLPLTEKALSPIA